MRTVLSVAVSAILTLATASAAAAQVYGDTAHFGPGISRVRARGTRLQLDLRAPAYGVLLRLAEGEPIQVLDVRDYAAGTVTLVVPPPVVTDSARWHDYAANTMTTTGSDDALMGRRTMAGGAGCVASQDRSRRGVSLGAPCIMRLPEYPTATTTSVLSAPRTVRDHLLLVLSTEPLEAAEVNRRLQEAESFASIADAARSLPAVLVGPSAPTWAGYLVRR